MTTIIRKLIQNHYELVGSFKSIEKRPYYAEIIAQAKEENMPVTEFLYSALGYTKTAMCSAEDLQKVRMAVTQDDQKGLEAALGDSANLDDIKEYLKSIEQFPVRVTNTKSNKNSKVSMYVPTLAEYYATCPELYVLYENNIVNLSQVIYDLRLRKEPIVQRTNLLFEDPNVKASLVKIVSGDFTPSISCGQYYINTELTEELKDTLQFEALSEAIQPKLGLSVKISKNFLELVTASKDNIPLYLAVLEFAKLHGITFANVMQKFGVVIPDYSNIYKLYGVVPVILEDVAFVYLKDQIVQMSTLQFYNMLDSGALKSYNATKSMEVFK